MEKYNLEVYKPIHELKISQNEEPMPKKSSLYEIPQFF